MARRREGSADDRLMARAVRLATAGTGATYPNPSVGAVVVSRGEVVGAARSDPTGGPHAEVKALGQAGRRAHGSTLYVTLEPCSHTGRTGPCTEAIIEAGVRRVVLGIRDPARHARGKGVRALARAGIVVVEGTLAGPCAEAHEHYLHHVQTGRPFVSLKVASSLDGCIATTEGDSKWITGARARRHGHRLRARHHAVAVGGETVLLDDPRLDVRLARGTDPIRVVFDSRLRIARADPKPTVLAPDTLVVHTPRASARSVRAVERTGAEPVSVQADDDGHVDLAEALAELGRRNIRSLLVEGGGRLHGAFVRHALWQRMFLYHAPRLLGDGRPMITGVQWPTVAASPIVRIESRRRLGDDLLTVLVPG